MTFLERDPETSGFNTISAGAESSLFSGRISTSRGFSDRVWTRLLRRAGLRSSIQLPGLDDRLGRAFAARLGGAAFRGLRSHVKNPAPPPGQPANERVAFSNAGRFGTAAVRYQSHLFLSELRFATLKAAISRNAVTTSLLSDSTSGGAPFKSCLARRAAAEHQFKTVRNV